jgi:hypothetical protein
MHHETFTLPTLCPGCNINEAWETLGNPCLACILATMAYLNPFHLRYQRQLEHWLSPIDSDSSESDNRVIAPRITMQFSNIDEAQMITPTPFY